MRHFRIKNDKGRFTAGEFESYEYAEDYARRQIRGFYTVVECDRYGNELNTARTTSDEIINNHGSWVFNKADIIDAT